MTSSSRLVRLAVAALLALSAWPLCACDESAPKPRAACGTLVATVAASDYASSAVGAFTLEGLGELASGIDLGKDPVLAESAGRVFFVARDEDRVFEIACGTAISKLNVGDPDRAGTTNPQDVAVAPDKTLWIPRYNVPQIALFRDDGEPLGLIDLTPYDDDGNPNASAIVIPDATKAASANAAGKAYVALQRLDDQDGLKSRRASLLLRIDIASRTVEKSFELAGRNPFTRITEHDGGLWLGLPGDFDRDDDALAGIERFDLATETSSLIVREGALGGSVVEFALDADCGAAIIADPRPSINATSLVTFDVKTGALRSPEGSPWLSSEGFDLQALAWASGKLLVGDRRRTPRGYPVHVFDRTEKCELRAQPDAIFLSQKPVALRALTR
jgi:hypothetical protein